MGRTSAFSLVEVLVAIILFVVLFLPAYTLFVQSRDTTFKSKLSYLSAQVARDEIEDLRFLARIRPNDIESFKHDWQAVKGNALARLKELALTGEPVQKDLEYPKEYGRIFTKVEVYPSKNAFIFTAVLHVRWQEHGEKFGAGAEKEKAGFSRFDFFLVRPRKGV